MHAYYGTDARLYQLLAGALLGSALRGRTDSQRRPAAAALATLVALPCLLVLGSGLLSLSPSVRGIAATGASVLLIGGLVGNDRTPIARLLSRPVPVFLGRVSYGTYLWHWPVILVLETVLVVDAPVVAVAAAVLSTALAALSYEVLELPIRRSAGLSRFTWQTAVVGLAASVLVAVTVVPLTLAAQRRPVLAAAAAGTMAPRAVVATSGRSARLPDDVDWEAVGDDVGAQRWCPPEEVAGCLVRRGSGPHVLVVGDSQAQMLAGMFTAMAEDHDLTLSFNILAGCMWQEALLNTEASIDSQERCTKARVGWYERALPRLDPDVVVLVGRPRDDVRTWTGVVQRRDGRDQPLAQAMLEATRETLATIDALGPRSLLVERMVMPETFDPADCLATTGKAADCAVPVPTDVAPSDGYYLTAAAESPRVFTANLNPAFCPGAPVCSPVVDGEVV
ncbi:MAG: acyltransferase [Nocardioidaceae bacterium]|nr:acyltransferase [Nocardioidaceae bacterium]